MSPMSDVDVQELARRVAENLVRDNAKIDDRLRQLLRERRDRGQADALARILNRPRKDSRP